MTVTEISNHTVCNALYYYGLAAFKECLKYPDILSRFGGLLSSMLYSYVSSQLSLYQRTEYPDIIYLFANRYVDSTSIIMHCSTAVLRPTYSKVGLKLTKPRPLQGVGGMSIGQLDKPRKVYMTRACQCYRCKKASKLVLELHAIPATLRSICDFL